MREIDHFIMKFFYFLNIFKCPFLVHQLLTIYILSCYFVTKKINISAFLFPFFLSVFLFSILSVAKQHLLVFHFYYTKIHGIYILLCDCNKVSVLFLSVSYSKNGKNRNWSNYYGLYKYREPQSTIVLLESQRKRKMFQVSCQTSCLFYTLRKYPCIFVALHFLYSAPQSFQLLFFFLFNIYII